MMLCTFCTASFAQSHRVDVLKTAESVASNGLEYLDLGHYTGVVYLQGMAELSIASKSDSLMNETLSLLNRFATGELKGYGSFISYEPGGNAVPFLAYRGYDQLAPIAKEYSARMWNEQPRNRDGQMVPPWKYAAEKNSIFIDVVLTVTPFLLYDGLLEKNSEYVDYATRMVLDLYGLLNDPASGLIHQARACAALPEGVFSQDCWSRGNGWGAMALASLMRNLPKKHPLRKDVVKLAKKYFASVASYQDKDGLWHQEMTWPDSYQEISGSALLLYGIGAGIESGVLPKRTFLPVFKKGLQGIFKYTDTEGNIGNTCSGCLAYGDGSKAAYAQHAYFTNELHSFGPVLLCLAQALSLGITSVELPFEQGEAIKGKLPSCYVRMVPERVEDIAWENNRAAFRIYSRDVRKKVSSGIDFWAKKVDYSIIDRWYAKGKEGGSYHKDNGEGCDFYEVGHNRGLGGSGIWTGTELVVPQPYANYRIYANKPSMIDFEVSYQPYKVGDDTVYETKRIKMVRNTRFFQVTSTIETESGNPVVLAVGISNFGKAKVLENTVGASLALVEDMGKNGYIGGAVCADPSLFAGFAKSGDNNLSLINVKSGESVVYYVGAYLNTDPYLDSEKDWTGIVRRSTYSNLTALYSK